MISRNRSMSTAAAMSVDRTTSANSTLTCLYMAASPETAVGEPHPAQNLAFSRSPVPHPAHATSTVMRHSHRLGHRDVSFEAKRFRHRAIATHQLSVGVLVAAGTRQQCAQSQQRDVAHCQTLV